MSIKDIEAFKELPAPEEPEWVSPDRSEWILSVSMDHKVGILKAPEIHDSFFDNGNSSEAIGFSEDAWDEADAGVYHVTASFWTNRCYETGQIDDCGFDVLKAEKLECAPDRLTELEAENKALREPWISVEDRLPSFGFPVVTRTAGGTAQVDHLTTAWKFTADHPIESDDPVTHWMPLPEPPATEGGEE